MGVSVKHFLGPRGTLLKQGLDFRREQLDMSEAVEEAIAAQKSLLIEAGTGVGKSLAYLLPAALAAARDGIHVLVSTHTKALQEQLVKKDLPFLAEALAGENMSMSFALFMGSENYLCLRRFHQAIRDADALFANDAHFDALARLKSFVDERPAKYGQSGLRLDLPDTPDDVWRNVLRESDNCMSTHSPFYVDCYHHAAQTQMKGSDILVVNHALFFSNVQAAGRLLPEYDLVIFDEAHSIEEVAASHLGISLTNFNLMWQLDQVYNPDFEKGLTSRFAAIGPAWRRGVMEQVKALRRRAEEFFQTLTAACKFSGEFGAVRVRQADLVPNTLTRPLEELADLLRSGRDRLESPEDKQELKAYGDRLSQMASTLDTFLKQADRMLVYWVEFERKPRGVRALLRASPIDLSRALRAVLFHENAPTAILTSATLTVKDEFDFMQSRLGATSIAGICLGSPFDYARQCLLYLPDKMPDPVEDDKYYAAVSDQARQLIEAAGGGVFVLCTSHDWVSRLYRDLSAGLPDFKFFKQGGPKSFRILDDFRASERAVLIGTDTFWTGVDVPGEALRLVIVTRLPFATPTHPLEEARVEYLRAHGYDPFTRHVLPTAVLMLRQGFGRLIRREDDRGVVALLDPRLASRAYGQVFLKSLPPAKRTSRLSDVKRFFSKVR